MFVLALTVVPNLMIHTLLMQFDVKAVVFIGDPLRFTVTFRDPSLTPISDCEKSI